MLQEIPSNSNQTAQLSDHIYDVILAKPELNNLSESSFS